MKLPNHLTALTLLLIFCTLLTSCQKCETCTYMVQDANGNRRTETFREICGKKYQRDVDRGACETMAALNGSICVCTKN